MWKSLRDLIDTLVRHNNVTAIIIAVGLAMTMVLRYGLTHWTQS